MVEPVADPRLLSRAGRRPERGYGLRSGRFERGRVRVGVRLFLDLK
jgi:hypothetical protein